MTTPTFDQVLDSAIHGERSDDVQAFYEYFEALKSKVKAKATARVKSALGESAIVQSAIFSMFEDVRELGIPMDDRDELGRPMLWPLLLRYLERHCDKWNKYYNRRKEQSLGTIGGDRDFDPADSGADAFDEGQIERVCETLTGKLTAEEREIFQLWVAGQSLEQTSQALSCSEAKVSYLRKRIRDLLLKE